MFKILKQSPCHVEAILIRNGIKVGLVFASPYDAYFISKEDSFKNTSLTSDEKFSAMMLAKEMAK